MFVCAATRAFVSLFVRFYSIVSVVSVHFKIIPLVVLFVVVIWLLVGHI